MYNHLITLITITTTKDSIGQVVETETPREVLCEVKSISQTEFYQAAQTQLRPELKVIMDKDDYQKEVRLQYDDEDYKVIRRYKTDGNEIELTCERVM